VLAPPRRFLWAGRDFSPTVQRVVVGQGQRLEIETDRFDYSFYRAESSSLRNKALEGELADGSRFSAELAYLDIDRAVARYWTLTHPERAPLLWVAALDGLRSLKAAGNLAVIYEEGDGDSQTTHRSIEHHRFLGAYAYYLVCCADAWFLIVDCGERGPPNREDVYPDMLAMQFVLGRAFFFDALYGLGPDGEVVGAAGGRHGRNHGDEPKEQPPVPLDVLSDHWASYFFEAISRTYRERPKLRLYIALSHYLDALASAHVENRYLVLHVALEAFSYWLLGGNDRPEAPLVDKSRWRAWLKARADEITALAAPGLGTALLNRIRSIPKRAASSRVVEDAFTSVGLTLTDEMVAELDEDGRGRIVHAAIMFEESMADVDRYLRRIALVRTMLVALVARVVGYDGRILGWERSPGRPYDAPDPTWWPVGEQARLAARRIYLADLRSGARG
jgi:hypothetical protein